jgi:hypothetical protein
MSTYKKQLTIRITQYSKEASFAQGLCTQAGRTTGCPQLPPLPARPALMATLECPSPRSWPVFCQLLAEAYLLSKGALWVRAVVDERLLYNLKIIVLCEFVFVFMSAKARHNGGGRVYSPVRLNQCCD